MGGSVRQPSRHQGVRYRISTSSADTGESRVFLHLANSMLIGVTVGGGLVSNRSFAACAASSDSKRIIEAPVFSPSTRLRRRRARGRGAPLRAVLRGATGAWRPSSDRRVRSSYAGLSRQRRARHDRARRVAGSRPSRRYDRHMPQSRGLHHLDLVVSDLERSRKFYSELLRPLGWGACPRPRR